jgi:hypothetical protein
LTRLREQANAQNRKRLLSAAGPEPFVTKQEVAERMRVSLGTVNA